ncbi:MAG: type II toxin-antitoxin system HicA family toxin [Lachnospiraceae bacterium]|nr:type II toxin-antitoxin system HicA family toxin [Lachnospiraceae bacterium]
MSQMVKLLKMVCSGQSDRNIRFYDLQMLLLALGFKLARVNGDHFIYVKDDIEEIINIQPDKGDSSKAKAVQVRQIRSIIRKYNMEV